MRPFPGKRGKELIEIDYMPEYILSGMIGIMLYYFRDKSRRSVKEIDIGSYTNSFIS